MNRKWIMPLLLLATLLGEASGVALSIVVTIHNYPTVADLNGPEAGTGYDTTYTEDTPPVPLVATSALTLFDPDQDTIPGIVVTLTDLTDIGYEFLDVTVTGVVTKHYDQQTGILTLSGLDTIVHYQAILRTLTYVNLSQSPTAMTHQVSVVVNDGEELSPPVWSQVTVIPQADPPVVDLNGPVAGIDHHATYMISSGPGSIVEADALTVTDVIFSSLTQATVQLVNRPDDLQESLAVTATGGISAAYNATTGLLTLTGPATLAEFQTTLRSLTYLNSSSTPDTTDRIVQVTVSDSSLTSAVATSTITFIPATIAITNLYFTYDGLAKHPTIVVSPPGIAYTVTYTDLGALHPVPSQLAPHNIGTYLVIVTVTELGYSASAQATMQIGTQEEDHAGGSCGFGSFLALIFLVFLGRFGVVGSLVRKKPTSVASERES